MNNVKRYNGSLVLVAGLVLIAVFLTLASAGIFGIKQGGSVDQRLLEISSQLHAPGDTMPMTVANSTVSAAWTMRRQIVAMLYEGMNNQAILRSLENEYGSTVLANPPGYGFGLFAWVLPVAVAIAAAEAGVLLVVRYSRNGAAVVSGSAKTATEELTGNIEKEWRQYL